MQFINMEKQKLASKDIYAFYAKDNLPVIHLKENMKIQYAKYAVGKCMSI